MGRNLSASDALPSAVQQLAAMREGATSRSLVQAVLDRIRARNRALNAVVAVRGRAALAEADEADRARARGDVIGPLHGLPFTAKDVFATTALPTTNGLPFRFRATRNAEVVHRLLDAGAILVGKTNVPFVSYDWQSKHPRFGVARNPHDPSRTPGGSSGGAAAALAAGMTSFEIGSDVAGSIRVPCHFCGVWGLRPTVGAVSNTGHAETPGLGRLTRILSVGPMTRDGADLSLLSSVLLDEAAVDPPCSQSVSLKWTAQVGDQPLSEEVAEMFSSTRERWRAAGVAIQDSVFHPWEEIDLWGRINGCELAHVLPAMARTTGIRQLMAAAFFRARLGPGRVVDALMHGFNASKESLGAWDESASKASTDFESSLGESQAWLMPVAPFVAFPHARTGSRVRAGDRVYSYADSIAVYNCSTAVLGIPAVAFPIGMTRRGLPVGVQVLGRRGDDMRLIAVARALAAEADA